MLVLNYWDNYFSDVLNYILCGKNSKSMVWLEEGTKIKRDLVVFKSLFLF